MPKFKKNFMKRIIFSSFLIAGIFISLSSFAAPSYGHCGWGGHAGYGYHGGYHGGGYAIHAGYGFHAGFGYAAPRVYYPAVPVPVVYGPTYPAVYNTPYYYGHPHYVHAFYRRPFYRRW